jgi:hypothetical protein
MLYDGTMPQLSIEIVYHDEHLIEIMTAVTNGRYSGVTSIYIGEDGQELIDFGNQLKGFPKSVNQVEEKEFGFTKKDKAEFQEMKRTHPKIKPASAYVGLKFYCIDQIGHPAVHVTIEEDTWAERTEASGKASFEMRFEPAQIDVFVNEIIELGKKKSGKATLAGIHDSKDTFV